MQSLEFLKEIAGTAVLYRDGSSAGASQNIEGIRNIGKSYGYGLKQIAQLLHQATSPETAWHNYSRKRGDRWNFNMGKYLRWWQLLSHNDASLSWLQAQTVIEAMASKQEDLGYIRAFENRIVKYAPSAEELVKHHFTQMDLEEAWLRPALLAGVTVLCYWDGYDGEHETLLYRILRGSYKGKFSIPGGHADKERDPFSTRELGEETGLRDARLLAIGWANQVIFKENDLGQIGLAHYLTMIWEITMTDTSFLPPSSNETWSWVPDSKLKAMAKAGQLTPIAQIALEAVGMI